MHVAALRLLNFRSYCDSSVRFDAGLNVVVGANATGKTNLLEGAWFALRGDSPRTRREEKLVSWGERYMRAELTLVDKSGVRHSVTVGYAPGEGKRASWDGVQTASLERQRSRAHVSIFVPESLLLVKGSPARRRAHLDVFAATLDPGYAAAARELQAVLRQRNAQLQAVKNGASAHALEPWDTQFARVAVDLGRRRREIIADVAPAFSAVATALSPRGERFTLQLITQLERLDYDESALRDELRARRSREVSRGLSLFGPQRDDLRFLEIAATSVMLPDDTPDKAESEDPQKDADDDALHDGRLHGEGGTEVDLACGSVQLPRGGRDLRLFGSQGEQRAAVLALLLAEQEVAAARTGEQGTLFLDDVMSELDDDRRRLLVRMLRSAGQAVITTTNRHYFTEDELAEATVIELPLEGSQPLVGRREDGEEPASPSAFAQDTESS